MSPRMVFGLLYVLGIVAAATPIAVDTSTWTLHHIDNGRFAWLTVALAVAMFGFMLITGKGIRGVPKQRNY